MQKLTSRLALWPALAGVFVALGPFLGTARGEENRSAGLAVPRDTEAQKATAWVNAHLRARGDRPRPWTTVDIESTLFEPSKKRAQRLARARGALEAGERAYDGLALKKARKHLVKALQLYRKAGPGRSHREAFYRTMTLLGAVDTLSGAQGRAEKRFVDLLGAQPDYEPKALPEVAMRVFNKALDRLENRPAGELRVSSSPPYAAVYLDGQFRGVSPVTLRGIPAGPHDLWVVRTGARSRGRFVRVRAKTTVEAHLELEVPDAGAHFSERALEAGRAFPQAEPSGAIDTLMGELDVDQLFLIRVTGSGASTTLEGGRFVPGGDPPTLVHQVLNLKAPRAPQALQDFFNRLGKAPRSGVGASSPLPSLASVPAPPPAPPTRNVAADYTPGPPASVYVGWSLVSVGAAAAITGGIFGALARKKHSTFEETAQGSPDLKGIQDAGKGHALRSDVFLIGGLIAAGAGILTLLLMDPDDNLANALAFLSPGGRYPTEEAAWVQGEANLP